MTAENAIAKPFDSHDWTRRTGVRRPIPLPEKLPEGLAVHCDSCKVVVPSDAPRSGQCDCEYVALHKLAWFNPAETLAGQFAMATAAWALIYEAALRAGDAECVQYRRQYQMERKAHFAGSAARQAMTPEQVEAHAAHRRDGWLFL
jgi:hypothetical protein